MERYREQTGKAPIASRKLWSQISKGAFLDYVHGSLVARCLSYREFFRTKTLYNYVSWGQLDLPLRVKRKTEVLWILDLEAYFGQNFAQRTFFAASCLMLFILDLICGNDFTSRLHYSYHDILSYFINQGKKFSEKNSKGADCIIKLNTDVAH